MVILLGSYTVNTNFIIKVGLYKELFSFTWKTAVKLRYGTYFEYY